MRRIVLVVLVAIMMAAVALLAAPAIAQEELPGATIGEQVEAHPSICHAKAGPVETTPCV